jgi:lysophospholipase L1-like esterase
MAGTLTLAPRSDAWLKVLLALLSPLVMLGLLEGAAYAWERQVANGPFAWELVASRRMVWEAHAEPGAGYTLIRPGSHYAWQGIPVDINAHGLRGPETTFPKPPGTYRILNLGDSIVMGWGVREAETYGRRLEQLLGSGAGERRIEVINAGVPGWNLDNALAYLQAHGLRYEPDLVVLDITLANDINGRSALNSLPDPGPLEWLRANTYFWPFLTSQAAWLRARAEGSARVDTINPPTNPAKYFPLDPHAERWTERWDTVLAIRQAAQSSGAPMVMVLFPLEFQVLDASYPALPQELFTAWAAEAGLPAVDLLPAFQRACQAKPGGTCYREDRYLFADVWMHPSALGHSLAAAELEPVLARLARS